MFYSFRYNLVENCFIFEIFNKGYVIKTYDQFIVEINFNTGSDVFNKKKLHLLVLSF